MSTINKALQGILFNGADLDLASATWKGKVSAIYGFNTVGNSYTVFKPTNTFNSLTKLVQDGAYIVAASAPGFELPGATLTAASATPTTAPVLTISDIVANSLPDQPYMELKCRVTSSNSADTTADVFASYFERNNPNDAAATITRVPLGQLVSLRFVELQNVGLSSSESIGLLAVAPSGAVGRATAFFE